MLRAGDPPGQRPTGAGEGKNQASAKNLGAGARTRSVRIEAWSAKIEEEGKSDRHTQMQERRQEGQLGGQPPPTTAAAARAAAAAAGTLAASSPTRHYQAADACRDAPDTATLSRGAALSPSNELPRIGAQARADPKGRVRVIASPLSSGLNIRNSFEIAAVMSPAAALPGTGPTVDAIRAANGKPKGEPVARRLSAAGIAAGAALTPKRAHILTARLQPFALATWRPRTYSPRDLVPGDDRSGSGGEDTLRRTLSEDPGALQVQILYAIR